MKLIKYLLFLAPILIFIVIISLRQMDEGQLGTKSNPIKFYFTPSVDAKTISTNSKPLTEFLHKETGYYFETAVPQSYVAVVEAFGTNKADIAILNTFSYLLAHEKFGAEARLRVVRVNNETTYRGQIITRVDSGIDSLKDLEGKTIAYVDAASTSGYILPKALLKKKDIKTSEETFGMKHDNVVTMVYQKQVDAGATFYSPRDPKTGIIQDARGRVVKQFPDVEQKIKILALTDAIPNDPCMFRKGLPEVMKTKIVNALVKFVSTAEGRDALDQIYSVRGLIPTKDSDYDVLRNLLISLNFSIKNIVK
jgi:phosphonate transport system substrate-binding protein